MLTTKNHECRTSKRHTDAIASLGNYTTQIQIRLDLGTLFISELFNGTSRRLGADPEANNAD